MGALKELGKRPRGDGYNMADSVSDLVDVWPTIFPDPGTLWFEETTGLVIYDRGVFGGHGRAPIDDTTITAITDRVLRRSVHPRAISDTYAVHRMVSRRRPSDGY
jgi:hypothetical protein